MLLPKIGTCASAYESGPYIRYELFWSPLTLCDEMKTIINKFYGVRISSLMENLGLGKACNGACRGWTSSIAENLDLGRNGLCGYWFGFCVDLDWEWVWWWAQWLCWLWCWVVGVVLAIAHAGRSKEIYYFIIMLGKIKNEM